MALLERLTQVEAFERFLHRTFPGKTRFSIEGLDMLVPILDEVIGEAAEAGLRRAFIGMAHRGRLNVMAHVLGKPYEQILAEFKDPGRPPLINGMRWSGDVKYHLGASRAIAGGEAVDLVVSMPPNPSHLEAIDPVLEGMARAAGTDASRGGASTFDPDAVLPILIHGDAAFPGQGIVAETLNLSRLAGYDTGGTIHIIVNNQLGFTTDPADSQQHASTASSLARGFNIPIVHGNADDPEACVAAARLAFAYRETFKRDVLIDLIGYRRYGHNEGDEPSFTQPLMYKKVAAQPTVRQSWASTLESRGSLASGRGETMLTAGLDALQKRYDAPRRRETPDRTDARNCGSWNGRPDANGRGARAIARPQRPTARGARGLHREPQTRTRTRQAAPGVRESERSDDRVGRRGRTGAGIDPRRRHAGSADRPGCRARHVQSAARDPVRRRHRPAVHAAPGAAGGEGLVRNPQQPAQAENAAIGFEFGASTASRHQSGWLSGRRSTATSSTAPRSCSTSS